MVKTKDRKNSILNRREKEIDKKEIKIKRILDILEKELKKGSLKPTNASREVRVHKNTLCELWDLFDSINESKIRTLRNEENEIISFYIKENEENEVIKLLEEIKEELKKRK